MNNFTVTQKLLSFGATYLVKNNATDTLDLTVKGKIIAITPKLEAFEGEGDKVVATVKGNFFKTQFDIMDANENVKASIKFPILSFLKSFTLFVDGKEYKAKGGLLARKFTCLNESGGEILTITKELKLRDQFNVTADDSISNDVATLSAIVIDQKFFQEK